MSSISVIVPNYNRAGLIAETLKNLLSQSHRPAEIIVVDDGSTDESVEVIKSFGKHITLVQQHNKGPGAARNKGMSIATGDYIQFQDSDDLLSLNKLESQAHILDETMADIALGPWAHVCIEGDKLLFETAVLQQSTPSASLQAPAWLLRGWSTIFQSLLFRRTFLIEAGNYRTDIRYGEDMEFLYRIFLRLPKIVIAPETLTLYRIDAPNKLSHDSGSAKRQRDLDWATCLRCMIEETRNHCNEIDRMTRWMFLANVRKHLRYIVPLDDHSEDLKQFLASTTREIPEPFLAATELAVRASERLRLALTGHRWMREIRATSPTPGQISLIGDMGLRINRSLF